MIKQKIGSGYYRTGHNCQKIRKANVYLIDGYLYAKDKQQSERLGWGNEITKLGFVPVNYSKVLDIEFFFQASLYTNEHKLYNP